MSAGRERDETTIQSRAPTRNNVKRRWSKGAKTMKVPSVNCGTHGRQPLTYVCVHILESLRTGEPKGFWWSRGEDGVWDAVCSDCNALSQEDFEALGPENIEVVCLGCFEDAAALNEIELK